jgi:uncharacterized repeat protein (TIGR01451 family)
VALRDRSPRCSDSRVETAVSNSPQGRIDIGHRLWWEALMLTAARSRVGLALVALVACISGTALIEGLNPPVAAAATVGLFQQCANNMGNGFSGACQWTNGNLNTSNSSYTEGNSAPQRLWLTGLAPGSTHTLAISYGTTRNGLHAYDFLTSFNWSEPWITSADRCGTITGCLAATDSTFPMPLDPNVPASAQNAVGAANRQWFARGATISAATTPVIVSGSYATNSETSTSITFTVASGGSMCTTTCGVAVFLGAHFATALDWGAGNGAGSINGSSFHTTLVSLDGTSLGSLSLSSSASIPSPGINIVKSASPSSVSAAGTTVTYSYLVTNTGNVRAGIVVTDPMPGLSPISCPLSSIDGSGASTTCTATYVVTQADMDAGSIHNTGTVIASPVSLGTLTATSSATVLVDEHASLTVVKSATPTSVASVGQTVTYSFSVTNAGNVTLHSLVVNDTQSAPAGPLLGAPSCPATTLAPGASTTCTVAYVVTQADLDHGSIKDTATAAALDPGNLAVTSAPSAATVTATQLPALDIVKSASPTSVSSLGQTITYTFVVTNTGNTTVTSLTVTDTQVPASRSLVGAPTCLATTLAPSASTTCTGIYLVNQQDLDNGTIRDSAIARALTTLGAGVTSPSDDATVAVVQQPSLSVLKTASPSSVATSGQTITYTFSVTNTGNVTIRALAIDDVPSDPAGPLTSGPTCPATTLAPGASSNCTATYVVTQDDIDAGSIHDSATARALAPDGTAINSAPSEATVVSTGTPSLSIMKSPTPSVVDSVGDTITYTFEVTNTGGSTLHSLAVADTPVAPAGPLATGPTCAATTLAPGAGTTCTGTYLVTQADLDHGSIRDSATASALTALGSQVTSDPSDATVAVAGVPNLTMAKAASPASVSAVGDVITYTFTVTNIGTVSMHSLSIDDVQDPPAGSLSSGPACLGTSLAPGDSTTCFATYSVTQTDLDHGSVSDRATATALTPADVSYTSPPASTDVGVTEQNGLTITKSASPSTVSTVGETVTYTFVVTNTGNVTVHSVTVADVPTGLGRTLHSLPSCLTTTLAPGDATTCTATYLVTQADLDTGTITDSASAAAISPSGATVLSGSATAVVGVDQQPNLTLDKAVAPSTYSVVGTTITYSITVANNGNVTMNSIHVSDTQQLPAGALSFGPGCPQISLVPGASMVCAASYVVTQSDLDHGEVTDTAQATAVEPVGTEYRSAPASATATAIQSPLTTLVKSATPTTVTVVGQTVT